MHEFSDDDFERASVIDELEWIEDDGLIRVVRDDSNQVNYNEDSDDEAPVADNDNQVQQMAPI